MGVAACHLDAHTTPRWEGGSNTRASAARTRTIAANCLSLGLHFGEDAELWPWHKFQVLHRSLASYQIFPRHQPFSLWQFDGGFEKCFQDSGCNATHLASPGTLSSTSA